MKTIKLKFPKDTDEEVAKTLLEKHCKEDWEMHNYYHNRPVGANTICYAVVSIPNDAVTKFYDDRNCELEYFHGIATSSKSSCDDSGCGSGGCSPSG